MEFRAYLEGLRLQRIKRTFSELEQMLSSHQGGLQPFHLILSF